MKIKDLENKSILILGLGREGLSGLKFISQHFPDKKVAVSDKKPKEQISPEVLEFIKNGIINKTYFGTDYLKAVQEYEIIIKSPGISPHQPFLEKAFQQGKITSGTDIFMSNCQGQVIGITGTKGKSTTASLIYEVLKTGGLDVELVGNIGIPVLDYLEKDSPDKIFIFEMSSHQLLGLKVSPYIAVMTNIYPEHLDYYQSFAEYVQAKANITAHQNENDYLIYNDNSAELKKIAKHSKAQKIPFSICDWSDFIINEKDIPLQGKFNLDNLVPAVYIGRGIFKIPDEKIRGAIMKFKPLLHRLEFVGEFKGIKFYNDSLATIPQATMGALQALGEDVETLITGGFDRGIDYSVLGEAIAKSKIKNLILFPDTGEKIWDAFRKCSKNHLQKYDVSNMSEAVQTAFKVTAPGKICLLSPASSSFNLFKDYEDRGNQFKKYVLIGKTD